MGWAVDGLGAVCKLLNGYWQAVCKPVHIELTFPLVQSSFIQNNTPLSPNILCFDWFIYKSQSNQLG